MHEHGDDKEEEEEDWQALSRLRSKGRSAISSSILRRFSGVEYIGN